MRHDRIALALLFLCVALLAGCSSKLKDETDFRPYIASWMGKNCGSKKDYNCILNEGGFADGGYDGEDFVYGVQYRDKEGRRRVVYVKIRAVKPYDAEVVGDEAGDERAEALVQADGSGRGPDPGARIDLRNQ